MVKKKKKEDKVKKERKKTKKKEKDPDAPKQPLSAFLLFQSDKREEIKSKLLEEKQKQGVDKVAPSEVLSKLGESWKLLSETEKKKYHDRHEELNKKYKEELKTYESSGKKALWDKKVVENKKDESDEESENEKKGKKSKKKDPNAPKKPMTAYFLYGKDHREEAIQKLKADNKDDKPKPTEVQKLLAEWWKKLSEEEKKVYTDKQAEEKRKYDEELEVYNKSDQKKEWENKVREEKKKESPANKETKKKTPTAKGKKLPVKWKGGKPSDDELVQKIKEIIAKQKNTSELSLKNIRKELEGYFGESFSDAVSKKKIEEIVTKEVDEGDDD